MKSFIEEVLRGVFNVRPAALLASIIQTAVISAIGLVANFWLSGAAAAHLSTLVGLILELFPALVLTLTLIVLPVAVVAFVKLLPSFAPALLTLGLAITANAVLPAPLRWVVAALLLLHGLRYTLLAILGIADDWQRQMDLAQKAA
ncbi:MAG: hypothetical protein JWQ89_3714 [Devosia sp.]|uniref:hypothetical protein n=1 Tax=Devosia sp. TaxID=1871048 RepID=UPI0026060280|nr:hypothetical protein [Devosia sp.]MDB5541987.1 hypothetical protein [Devosia sp.]